MASATMPGSMTSPSTIASFTTEVNATLVSTGPPEAWEITTSLMSPLPMSRPTVVALRPKSPIGFRLLRGGSGQLCRLGYRQVPGVRVLRPLMGNRCATQIALG